MVESAKARAAREADQRDRQEAVRRISAAKRSKVYAWTAPSRARVIDRQHGETIVPCRSPLAALQCAAEVWGCDWEDLRNARVQAI